MNKHMKYPSASFAPLFFLFLFMGFLRFSLSTPSPWNVSHSDEQTLLGFKAALTFHPNNSLANWSSNTSFCKWTGVTCSRPPMQIRVVRLNLSSAGLEGTISPVLGNLSALQSLDFSDNALRGNIPAQLGQLYNVKELILYLNQLEGNIPASLGRCSSLVLLVLSNNKLEGSIPPEIGFLPHLEMLFLARNSLTGRIPSSIGNLSSLTELHLSTNNLTGTIPREIGMLTKLKDLYIHTNDLSGTIPDEVNMLTELQFLLFNANELSGTIPPSLGNLSFLIYLDLSGNNLVGTIPNQLGMLINLEVLYLYANELVGTIPSSIGNLSYLRELELTENNLSGSIPISILNCRKLVTLYLSMNHLDGYIPWDIGNKLNKLQELFLWGNMLIGKIPTSIENCTNLKELYLSNNFLHGMVPIELGKLLFLEEIGLSTNLLGSGNTSLTFLTALTNCSRLQKLHVDDNNLTGILPSSIGQISSKLSKLDLSWNKIGGCIPQQITNLTSLTTFYLSHNLLTGHIPSGIGRFHKLERLDLSSNILDGRIPQEIGQMESLGLLNVSYNKLSGRIPTSLGRLEQLRRIFLNDNHFSGEIPPSLATCQNVELLDLSHNHLRGNIPGEVMVSLKSLQFYLNLSCNFLQGPLPGEISEITSVQAIDVSGNRLHGEIPGVLVNCIALVYLNLSHNIFQGPIPGDLSKLQNLEDIDLSFNFLSGSIPVSLRQMRMLRYMNVSFNNLTGYVGEELFLNNTILLVFMGNPGLCGSRKYFLPPCAKEGQGKKSALRNKLLVAAGVIAFILFSSIMALIWRWKFSRPQPAMSSIIFEKMGYPKFSYQDLVIATNGFNEENLLGVGNFGSVYKGTLENGRAVALKVFHMENKGGERSFKKECKVLGRIRHRNVIKVISACSFLNFKALVLQFACNGSLEKLLYMERDEEDVCRLGLGECLNIAIDVAHGMEYLHHDCFTRVVHCDLKPSNVLLDADMTALVSDFGISRLTSFSDSLGTTSAARGTIGYIAPEYGLGEGISVKGDVYSYGILLLEMATRKRPTDAMFVGDLNLRSWVMSAFPNSLVDVVDNQLLKNMSMEQQGFLMSFTHVGLLCCNQSPQDRPTMREVVRTLESVRTTFMGSATRASYLSKSIPDLLAIPSTSHAAVEGVSDSSTY